MPTPTVITDLSTTAASNFPAGSDAPSTIDDTLRAHGAFIRQIYDGPLIPAYGSAGAPAYGFTSDPNTGWYGEGSDVLSAATGGTKRVSIGAAGNITTVAPGSGVSVTVNGVSGANALVVNGGPIRTTSVTVAALLTPATAGAGARAFATDATGTTFGSVPVGGGSNGVPVYCDGTDWRIG
jgi:hypothetical protein